MRRSHLILTFLIVPLAVSSGCSGGNTVWITGKLLKGGTPYVPPNDQLVTITFVALELQGQSGKPVQTGDPYLAEYDQARGTFTVPGPDRQGIPPGKYRVAVTQKMKREAFDAAHPRPKRGVNRETDMLADRFGIGTSPIFREVKRSQEVTIDLDRPTKSS
ncbi:MAG TPA: hypothetical protein VFF52_21935 [Isosphaeraceae bacterium]|nr:hypothetical protein [Isosphaeraceae bacterium]